MKYIIKIIFINLVTIIFVNTGWGQTTDKSPNIVYILIDDLGYGDINLQLNDLDVFNNTNIQTPNLARLAQESMVFTHHYSADPLCSPARAGLLTGRTPTRANIPRWIGDRSDDDRFFLSGKEITIAEILKENGYQTAVFGKWHLNGADWSLQENWTGWTGSFPNQQGFDYAVVSKENPHETTKLLVNTQKDPGDYYLDTNEIHGKHLGTVEGYTSQIITDSAIDWVKNKRDQEEPYFLYLPYDAVHEKVESPVAFNSIYNTGNTYKDMYYGNITYLDAQIGRFLDFLFDTREKDNTIIFFSSDNGPETLDSYFQAFRSYGTSAPLFGQKKHLFEGGIRVPGMVRWPGKIEPGISDLPNSHLDVFPTISDLIGIDLPQDRAIDGTSILPHLLNHEDIERDKPLYWQTIRFPVFMDEGVGYERRFNGNRPVDLPLPRVVIRRGEYVLRGFTSNRDQNYAIPDIFQLYNVVTDRQEMVELSHFKPEVYEEMKVELLEMWRDVNADREQTAYEIENKIDQRN